MRKSNLASKSSQHLRVFLFVTLVSLSANLISCSSVQKVEYESQTKYWQVKAMIIDHKKEQKHFVDLEMFAQNKSKLRINASGPMGVALMNLVLVDAKSSVENQNLDSQYKVEYILPQQKKHVSSQSFEKAMQSLLKVKMDSGVLFSILYDEDVSEKSIKKPSKIKINWVERKEEIRKVSLGDQNFELQLVFDGAPTNVQPKAKMFQIEAPSHYTHQVIQ